MPEARPTPRKIIGFSLSPALARSVNAEALKRGLSLCKLFEERGELYKESKKS